MEKKSRKVAMFTLIELLVVVAVIAILMGILLPVFTTVRTQGKIAKARQEAKGILTAIKSYEGDYGLLPWHDGDSNTTADASPEDADWDVWTSGSEDDYYDVFMEILTGVEGPDADSDIVNGDDRFNARKIKFLDVDSDYTTAGYVDPWDNRYAIGLDLDYDGAVTVGGDTLNGTVFVYSFGPDKADDDGDDDDICTWK